MRNVWSNPFYNYSNEYAVLIIGGKGWGVRVMDLVVSSFKWYLERKSEPVNDGAEYLQEFTNTVKMFRLVNKPKNKHLKVQN